MTAALPKSRQMGHFTSAEHSWRMDMSKDMNQDTSPRIIPLLG